MHTTYNTVVNTIFFVVIVNEWTLCLDGKKPIDIQYLDFQKAFDKVPHKRLISKLQAYGIDGNLLSWIISFLSNRRQ